LPAGAPSFLTCSLPPIRAAKPTVSGARQSVTLINSEAGISLDNRKSPQPQLVIVAKDDEVFFSCFGIEISYDISAA
jgi:hypothetical protein